MEWEREKCLELVDIYEQYPVLWNPKHGFYYNKIKKHDAWVIIAEKMQRSTREVKKKMDSMLASFRREKSKGKKTVGTGKARQEIYLSKWFAFTRMAFLLDRDEPTQTISSLEDDIESEEVSLDETTETVGDLPDDQRSEINNILEETVEQISESQTALPKLKRSCSSSIKKGVKRKIPPEDNKMDEAFGMLKTIIEKQKTVVISDPCSDYGKHVGNQLKNYSKKARAIVQHHINNILFQADMGHYDLNTNPATINYGLPSNHTTPIPTPSPQETNHSDNISYTDLSSPSDLGYQEQLTSVDTAANYLKNWQ